MNFKCVRGDKIPDFTPTGIFYVLKFHTNSQDMRSRSPANLFCLISFAFTTTFLSFICEPFCMKDALGTFRAGMKRTELMSRHLGKSVGVHSCVGSWRNLTNIWQQSAAGMKKSQYGTWPFWNSTEPAGLNLRIKQRCLLSYSTPCWRATLLQYYRCLCPVPNTAVHPVIIMIVTVWRYIDSIKFSIILLLVQEAECHSQVVTNPASISEGLGTNLGRDINILIEYYFGFTQSTLADTRTLLSVSLWLLLSTFFKMHYSSNISSSDAA